MSDDLVGRGCIWAVTKAGEAISQAVGAALGISAKMATRDPVNVAEEIQKTKLQLESGIVNTKVNCHSCQTANEQGQVECYQCGALLVTQRKINVPSIQGGGMSPLAVQWLVLGGLFLLGFILMQASNSSNSFGMLFVGCFLMLACVGWFFGLIRLTLGRRR